MRTEICEVITMSYWDNKNTITSPETVKEFNDGVKYALKTLYDEGSRTVTVKQIYRITKWTQNESNSHRISMAFSDFGMEKINSSHYNITKRCLK